MAEKKVIRLAFRLGRAKADTVLDFPHYSEVSYIGNTRMSEE